MLLANLIVWFAKEHLLRIFDCRRFTVADDHVNVKDDADEQDWRQDWRHRRLHLDAVGWSHWRSDNWKTCPTSPLIKAFILKILFPTQKKLFFLLLFLSHSIVSRVRSWSFPLVLIDFQQQTTWKKRMELFLSNIFHSIVRRVISTTFCPLFVQLLRLKPSLSLSLSLSPSPSMKSIFTSMKNY